MTIETSTDLAHHAEGKVKMGNGQKQHSKAMKMNKETRNKELKNKCNMTVR